MPKNPKADEARKLFQQGLKLTEIAEKLQVPQGTVRRWKHAYGWSGERSVKSAGVREQAKKTVEKVIKNTDLSSQQQLFCLLFSRSLNATSAYQKAYGCGYASAMTAGCELLRKPKIKAEIQRLKRERFTRAYLAEEDIFQKYMDIAFSDITDYLEFGTEEVPVMSAYGPMMKTVNAVRFKPSSEVNGSIISEVKQGRDGASIKLADRQKALDWLAAHMDLATDEQKARIDNMKASTDRIRQETGEDSSDGVEIINDAPG